MVVILGLSITLVLWLLLAIPCMRFATAKGAKPSDYEGLQREVEVLNKQLQVVKSEQTTQDTCKSATPTGHYKAAIADIESNLDDIDKKLKRDGLTWLSTGYVSLWDRINKADEAIIDVLPCKTVIESAKYEQLRLKNSLVPDSEDYLKLLDKAIQTLSSDPKRSRQSSEQNQDTNLQHSLAQAMLALLEDGIDSSTHSASTEKPLYKRICHSIVRIFQPDSHQQDKANKLQQYMAQAMLALLKKATDNGQVSQQSVQEARSDIRKVKAAIHNFTNERWDGLVRLRNQLMGTAFLTAFFTYILVIFAILENVRPIWILEAMLFYFLGAIVGLFGRLYGEQRKTDKVTDDYGLSMARIIVTPIYSGLAALVGVLLAITLSISISNETLPVGTTIGGISKSLVISLQNLIVAAIFGYAPNILIDILRSRSEEIKNQLKSASPSDQKSGNGRSGSSKENNSGDSG